jgi:hypothetical protein
MCSAVKVKDCGRQSTHFPSRYGLGYAIRAWVRDSCNQVMKS